MFVEVIIIARVLYNSKICVHAYCVLLVDALLNFDE